MPDLSLKPCAICGTMTTRRTCNRTHENMLWRQENPEAYAAARARYKAKQKEGHAQYTKPKPVTGLGRPSYIDRILACRDSITHSIIKQIIPPYKPMEEPAWQPELIKGLL